MSFQEKAAGGQRWLVFVMALVFVFLILAAQYESWSTAAFRAARGSDRRVRGDRRAVGHALFSESYENNVFAQIGLVMLIGMSAKNAILIVEFAKVERERRARAPHRGRHGSRAPALPSDPDDRLLVHSRRAAAARRDRRRRRGAQGDGPACCWCRRCS